MTQVDSEFELKVITTPQDRTVIEIAEQSTPSTRVRIVGSVLIAILFFTIGTSRHIWVSDLTAEWFALTIVGSIVLHLRAHFSVRDAVLIPILAAVVGALDVFVFRLHLTLFACLSLLGLSSLAILATRTVWSDTRRLFRQALGPALLFVALSWGAARMLLFTTALHPKTFDLYLYAFDGSLGVQIPFMVGHWFQRVAWLRSSAMTFYMGLPLLLALVYAAQMRNEDARRRTLWAFLTTGPIGIFLYNLVPATGPVHVFRFFPNTPIEVSQISHLALQTVPVPGLRNAIPSLHMAWALLAFWNSRRTAFWVRATAFVFVLFTILATLGSGEHYFVDLVIAFPFALMVQGIASVRFGQWRSSVYTGVFVTLAWLALLTFAVPRMWVTRVLPWTFVALTIGISLMLNRNLRNSIDVCS